MKTMEAVGVRRMLTNTEAGKATKSPSLEMINTMRGKCHL